MNAAQYRTMLNAAVYQFAMIVRAIFTTDGVPVTDEQRIAVALKVIRRVQDARLSTYGAARTYLRTVDPGVDAALPLVDYGLGAPLELIKRVVTEQAVTEAERFEPMAVDKAAKAVARGLQNHAERPARDLVAATAEATEGAAWQRVLTGPTSCAFCAMLASRGPIYTRKDLAFNHGPGESIVNGVKVDAYHDGCDCIAIFVPAGSVSWEGRAEWKRLAHMWRQADNTEDDDRPTRNIFRSFWEAEVRKGNGGRYVAESIIPTAA